jgi:hypothetical protein
MSEGNAERIWTLLQYLAGHLEIAPSIGISIPNVRPLVLADEGDGHPGEVQAILHYPFSGGNMAICQITSRTRLAEDPNKS